MPDPVSTLARLLVTAATLAYGLGPFFVDLNKTHLVHPAWPGHARFHLLWASTSQLAVAAVALHLCWSDSADAAWRFRLGAVIGLCMTSGFWGALLFRKLYRGTLHDPQGIRPLFGKVDGNLIAVILIDGLLIGGLLAA